MDRAGWQACSCPAIKRRVWPGRPAKETTCESPASWGQVLRPSLFYPLGQKRKRAGKRPADPCLINGGAEEDRTLDLMTASHALSQLSYSPTWLSLYNLCRALSMQRSPSPTKSDGYKHSTIPHPFFEILTTPAEPHRESRIEEAPSGVSSNSGYLRIPQNG
jgi:hypothetical protein